MVHNTHQYHQRIKYFGHNYRDSCLKSGSFFTSGASFLAGTVDRKLEHARQRNDNEQYITVGYEHDQLFGF
jgi:hypothetical protein